MIENIAKYNFWNGNNIPTGYERRLYTDNVYKYIGNTLIKVIIGQRRIGKSYILRQIAKRLIDNGVKAENILYINKEYLEYDEIGNYSDLQRLYLEYKDSLKPKGKTYIFIDEIQNIDGWERFVDSHSQDFAEPTELFISGSNSKLLSGELASLLSGRYVEFEVFSLSFNEFCDMKGLEKSKATYMQYLHTGALPELVNLGEEEMCRNYTKSIKDTVILRDIVQRYKVKDVRLLDDIFTYIVNNASSLISITNIINYFASKKRKTNYETIASYLGFLQNSYLVHKVDRYNIKGKDTISGNAKYYINDLAYHNYIYPGMGYGDGYMLENAIYLELRRKGYKVYVGIINNKEVDFVALNGDKRIYVQVSLELVNEETKAREYGSLNAISDNYRKIVVSLDDYPISQLDGIEHVKAWEL